MSRNYRRNQGNREEDTIENNFRTQEAQSSE